MMRSTDDRTGQLVAVLLRWGLANSPLGGALHLGRHTRAVRGLGLAPPIQEVNVLNRIRVKLQILKYC